MFRIRRIYDDLIPIDERQIAQIQQILRQQFPGATEAQIAALPEMLRNPFKHRFRAVLYVADDAQGTVRGFALAFHEPQLKFWYLDFIAAGTQGTGGGVGGALYAQVCEEVVRSGAIGLFFECAPDDDVDDKAVLKQNIARLRFYERFGARPLDNNDYRRPVWPGQRELPFLMFDDQERGKPLRRQQVREVVRAVLERKYGDVCSPEYVDAVVASFRDDPVRLRPFRYVKPNAVAASGDDAVQTPPETGATTAEGRLEARGRKADARAPAPPRPRIALVVNDKHDIHHVRERGYVEAPARVRVILKEIEKTGLFRPVPPRSFPDRHVLEVHERGFVEYLKRTCQTVPAGKSVYPYVFPIRNQARPPKELAIRAGYYCIDTFTPLNRNAYPAAKRAVDCVLTAAEEILRGDRLAYALVRPPGHHAERRSFGGFCYFCNVAIAAQFFSPHGRVAILDVDYHHGNGQEEIFYERDDVLTVSIHGHPRFAYPYFSGFQDDRGLGQGEGYNANYPLPERVDGERYRRTLAQALRRIQRFAPRFLIVALGLDTARGDPTGSWSLSASDLERNGRLIGGLRLPTLVVQEGGYRTRTLGVNARQFFVGLAAADDLRDGGKRTRNRTSGQGRTAPKGSVEAG
ncbi:MAG: histone deacetylase family protein [Phycisphaerales bacterium]|nr:MAG: histone deacetylase family protein [Phycisphaerales bacterium]